MSLADALRLAGTTKAVAVQQPFDILREMSQRLTSESSSPPPFPEWKYRVSHVIKLCPREEAMRYLKQIPRTEKIDAKLQRIFDFGRAFHTLAQNEWFGKWGLLIGDWECLGCHAMYPGVVIPKVCGHCFQSKFFYHEIEPSSQEHGITAHVDGIILFNDRKYILELKTTNSMQFNLIANINRKPLDSHRKQIQLYMFLCGVKDGIILYMEKNESSVHFFEEKYDEALVKSILDNLAEARRVMKDRILPERTVCVSKSCSRAKQCGVRDLCFS